MKIAIDVSQTVYETGVSNYTKELIKALLKIDAKNQYILFGFSLRQFLKLNDLKKDLTKYSNVSFKFLPLPISLFELLWNKLHLLKLETFVGDMDLVHTSDWLEPPTGQNTKRVTTVHDMVVYLFPTATHPRIAKNQKAKLEVVKDRSGLIIADSQATKEDLVKFLQIPENKVRVIYLAPDSSFHPQDEDKIKQTLQKYKIKTPFILSVATQEPRKNIQKLIDVFKKVKDQRKDLTLILVGKYGWGDDLAKAAEEEENIKITGFIPKQDLINLYSACRVFVYPSLYEGFGLPILEAMACGAPTITSNNSSMLEIAKDAAILVDPRSENQIQKAIELMLDLKLEDYQKMVNASLNRARQYSWAKTAKQTLEIYREIVSQQTKNNDHQEAKREEKKVKSMSKPLKELSL